MTDLSGATTELKEIKNCYGDTIIIDNENINFVETIENKPTIATMSSGAGLEAAIHGCTVISYCISFYSNWGFTIDKYQCDRRTNMLSVEDVFLYVYTQYTTYLHPYKAGHITPLEALRGTLYKED